MGRGLATPYATDEIKAIVASLSSGGLIKLLRRRG
jgi:hypothetical protein